MGVSLSDPEAVADLCLTAKSPPDAAGESAAGLLAETRRLQVQANRAEMARARATTRLFQHLSADHAARAAEHPHQTLPPLTETFVETQPVTGQTKPKIRADLETVLVADQRLPWLAGMLDAGALDLYRARPIIDALTRDLLEHPEARELFGRLLHTWLANALAAAGGELITKTITQIRNHLNYLLTIALPRETDDRFRRRHARRDVTSSPTGDGMAELRIDTDQVSISRAEHHLDLLARAARADGDPRTLGQLRADLAIDLLTGAATTTEAGNLQTGQIGAWARPIINITVPIQTLMGLADDPGRMGPHTLPPSLVRQIATEPGATWYRLLTDSSRHGIELSTTSYQPTGPIWREVVALHPVCYAPTCERAATDCDLDHRVPHPDGPTATGNLGPGCRTDHRAKHAPGAALVRQDDGTLAYTTRAGLTHHIQPVEQPTGHGDDAARVWDTLTELAPTAGELLDALQTLREHHRYLDTLDDQVLHRQHLEADYRRSYPEATEEDFDHWVWDPIPDPANPAPPVLRRALDWDTPPQDELTLSKLIA